MLVLALVIGAAAVSGCGKRTYTVTVSEAAPPRASARTPPSEALDRKRASADRLRERGAAVAKPREDTTSLVGSDSQGDAARGTSGFEQGETPASTTDGRPDPPSEGTPARGSATRTPDVVTPGAASGLALDTVATVAVLAAIAVAIATVVMLARRRRVT